MELEANVIDELRERLQREEGLVAAYLLGSAAAGRMTPLSDVDLAVLPVPGRRLDLGRRLELAATLHAIVHRTVDIGCLGHDNLVYTREALLSGKCLFCHDGAYRDLFVATTLAMYAALRVERKEVERAYTSR
jgi:predicted nucleotidyltransferase